MTTTPAIVSRRIHAAMRAKGMDQQALALHIGCKRALVSHFLNSRRSYLPYASAMAKALGVTEEWLSDGAGKAPEFTNKLIKPRSRGRPSSVALPQSLLSNHDRAAINRRYRYSLCATEACLIVNALSVSDQPSEYVKNIIDKICLPYGGYDGLAAAGKLVASLMGKMQEKLKHSLRDELRHGGG